jgi:hypothetical protein
VLAVPLTVACTFLLSSPSSLLPLCLFPPLHWVCLCSSSALRALNFPQCYSHCLLSLSLLPHCPMSPIRHPTLIFCLKFFLPSWPFPCCSWLWACNPTALCSLSSWLWSPDCPFYFPSGF